MPYLGTTVFVTGLIVGLWIGIAGFGMWTRAMLPGLVLRARERWHAPWRNVLVGSGVATLLLGIATNLVQAGGPVAALGIALAALTLGAALLGVVGLADRVGERLTSPHDATRPWLRTLRGLVILLGAWMLPVLGWFLLMPLCLAGGLGAFVHALRHRGPAHDRPSSSDAEAVHATAA